ncbi:hypothetical protein HID58_042759, partial [Brassica napus]
MTVDEHNEPSDDAQRVAELQKQVDEKLSQLQSENTVLRDQNQARSRACNKKRRPEIRMMMSSERWNFLLQFAISSTPITDKGPMGKKLSPPTDGRSSPKVEPLRFSISAVRSKEDSKESIDSRASFPTLCLERTLFWLVYSIIHLLKSFSLLLTSNPHEILTNKYILPAYPSFRSTHKDPTQKSPNKIHDLPLFPILKIIALHTKLRVRQDHSINHQIRLIQPL